MVGLGKGVGVPVKLLHESEGHVVTVRSLDVDARRRRSMRDCAMFSRNDAREARAGEDREGEESTLTPRTRAKDGFAKTRKATDDDARFANDDAGGA
jgi:hypothetical protein